jgi:hypothetical protein
MKGGRAVKHMKIVTGLSVLVTAILLPTAAHAVFRYGVACVKNHTEHIVFYQYKEADGTWHGGSLRPGWETSFAHKYSRPNEDRSPELDIKFDSDLTAQRQFTTTYKLPRRAAVGDSCKEGAQYAFQYDGGNRRFIDLKRAP